MQIHSEEISSHPETKKRLGMMSQGVKLLQRNAWTFTMILITTCRYSVICCFFSDFLFLVRKGRQLGISFHLLTIIEWSCLGQPLQEVFLQLLPFLRSDKQGRIQKYLRITQTICGSSDCARTPKNKHEPFQLIHFLLPPYFETLL